MTQRYFSDLQRMHLDVIEFQGFQNQSLASLGNLQVVDFLSSFLEVSPVRGNRICGDTGRILDKARLG